MSFEALIVRLAVAALCVVLWGPPSEAQNGHLSLDTGSKRACRAHTDGVSNSQENYRLCLFDEYVATEELALIAGKVPTEFVYSCNSETSKGDDYQRGSYVVMLDCFNRHLARMPEAGLPRGSATLYVNGTAHRYWTVQQCEQKRTEGQVCVVH